MSSRPNLLFILADQLRTASLPLQGETQIETPHLRAVDGPFGEGLWQP